MSLSVHRWILPLCLAVAAWLGAEFARGETVVRLVIVSTAGLEGSDQDAAMASELFQAGLAGQARVEVAPVVRLPNLGAKKESILRAIRDLPPSTADDVILFYYSGHGAYSADRGEHVLVAGREMLPRSELRDLLVARQPRLAVILTDCCSDVIAGKPARPTIDIPNLKRVMRVLLLETRGLVDVTSASTGERAWGEGSGGLFTRAFFETAWSNKNVTSWKGFFEATKAATQQKFVGFKEAYSESKALDAEERDFLATQQAQTPFAFQLGAADQIAANPTNPDAATPPREPRPKPGDLAPPPAPPEVPPEPAPPEAPPEPAPPEAVPPPPVIPRPIPFPRPAPPLPGPPAPAPLDLSTMAGKQLALLALGYAPGKPDGIYGPQTRTATMKFQESNRLIGDGIFGPKTLAKMREQLQSRGIPFRN